jgi:hypothetical protein
VYESGVAKRREKPMRARSAIARRRVRGDISGGAVGSKISREREAKLAARKKNRGLAFLAESQPPSLSIGYGSGAD